jgi:hypothetical protein
MGVPKVRIERLCWLAVRDRIARGGRDNPVLAVFRVRSGLRYPRRGRAGVPVPDGLGDDLTSGRMASFGFAVYDVAQRLSVAERRVLRETGEVPGWFLAAVYRRRRELRWGRLL